MKKGILYVMVGAITTTAAGAGSFLLTSRKGKEIDAANYKAQQQEYEDEEETEDPWGDQHKDDDLDDSELGKMLKKVLSYNVFKTGSSAYIGFKAPSLMGNELKVNLGNTDMNFLDSKSPKIAGRLGLEYGSVKDELKVNYDSDDEIYFSYLGTNFKVGVNSSYTNLLDLVNAVSSVIPSSPKVSEAVDLGSIDLNALLAKAAKTLNNVEKTTFNNSNAYHVSIETVTLSGLTVSNIDAYLTYDEDENFTGLYTGTVPLTITKGDQSFELNLSLPLQMSKKGDASTYQGLSDKSSYTSIDSTTNSILSTLGNYAKNKNFAANMKIALSTDEDVPFAVAPHALELDVAGDFSKVSAVEDFETKGRYQLELTDKIDDASLADGQATQKVHALYDSGTTYVNLNDDFKGKLTNSTIKDVIASAKDLTKDDTVESSTDKINEVLKGLKNFNLVDENNKIVLPASLINADYGLKIDYKTDKAISFMINAKAFNLGNANLTIAFDVDEEGAFKDLSIKGLDLNGYKLNTTIAFAEFKDTTIKSIDVGEYKDYQIISPLFSSIANIASKKQFNATYSLNATKKGTTDLSYALSGKIDGDFNGTDTSKKTFAENNIGKYHFSADLTTKGTKYLENDHFDAKVLNQNLYFEYGDGLRNRISGGTVDKALSLIEKKSGSKDVSATLKKVSDVLDKLQHSKAFSKDMQELIHELSNGYLGGKLSSFLSLDKDNKDVNSIIVRLNLPLVFADNLTVLKELSELTLTINASTSALTDISMDLDYGTDTSLRFDLALADKEFSDADLKFNSEEEEAGYTSLDHPISSFLNLPNKLEEFDLGLTGSVSRNDKTLVSLKGNSSIHTGLKSGYDKNKVNGDGYMVLTDPDNHSHKLEYTYIPDDGTNSSYAGTTVEYNDKMHVRMTDESVIDMLKSVSDIKETNALVRLIKYLQSASESLPLLEAVKSGDLTILRHEMFSDITLNDNELSIKVKPQLFITDASDEAYIQLKFVLDPAKEEVKSASLAAHDLKGYDFNIELGLNAYTGGYKTDVSDVARPVRYHEITEEVEASGDEKTISSSNKRDFEVELETEASKDKFVDFENVASLLKMGIRTTDESYYYLTGKLSLGAVIGKDISFNAVMMRVHVEIKLEDEAVKSYIAVSPDDSTDITKEGFMATEFFLSSARDDAYLLKTVNNEGGEENISSAFMKVSYDELKKNPLFYLADYALDFRSILGQGAGGKAAGNLAMANIYKALEKDEDSAKEKPESTRTEEEKTDVSSLFSFDLTSDYSDILVRSYDDTTDHYMGMDLDLNKIGAFQGDLGKNLHLGHVLANVFYSEGENPYLTSLEIKGRSLDSNNELNDKSILKYGTTDENGNYSNLLKVNFALHLDNHLNVSEGDRMQRYNAVMQWVKVNKEASELQDIEVTSIEYSKLFNKVITDATVSTNGNYLTYTGGKKDSIYYFQVR